MEGKHSLTKNIFWFFGSEINVVVLFSIVILHSILCRLGWQRIIIIIIIIIITINKMSLTCSR